MVDLVEEGVDIALRMGALRNSSLAARKIGSGRRLVVGAPAYLEHAGIPRTPAELSAHAAVIYIQNGIGDRWSFHRHGSETSVRLSGRLRVSAAEGLREAVLGGIGLAVASEWMFAPELASGAVRTVLSEWTLPADRSLDGDSGRPDGQCQGSRVRSLRGGRNAQAHSGPE